MAKNQIPPGTNQDSAAPSRPYVVLARKYRPQTFEDLIGQDAMVRTLRNAFAADRIAQGYMLTGVRGVGKTTTARILARALNYSKPGLLDRPSTDMPDFGVHCREIIESRHPDVLEIDAASNTGVDNIREIIERARYRPFSARYKVYVIDEVHMLSKGAFNALLKTLEEPPEHVKFIFATTEVRKVPVTVLSRCQRFDLRRVDVPALVKHMQGIVTSEQAKASQDALLLIARAAEGSVRDALSILDQAIAMGGGQIETDSVRAMLGLADRGRIFDLLETIMRGAAPESLQKFADLCRDGADPLQVLSDLAEAIHVVSRIKAVGPENGGEGLPGEEKRRSGALAANLSMPLLARSWQMLLKGIEEAGKAPDAGAAAEMILIRLAYSADLPSPDELIRTLDRSGARSTTERPAPLASNRQAETPTGLQALQSSEVEAANGELDPGEDGEAAPQEPGPAEQIESFSGLVELVGFHRDARLKVHLEEHVSLVRFDPAGKVEIALLPGAPRDIANDLREKLSKWTRMRWLVALSNEHGDEPLGEVRRRREAAETETVKSHPAVQAVLEQFPEARIARVRKPNPHGSD